MALVFMDGFDHYDMNQMNMKWENVSGGPNYIMCDGNSRRSGTKYFKSIGGNANKHVVDTVTGEDIYSYVVGCACLYTTVAIAAGAWSLQLQSEGGTPHVYIRFEGDGKVKLQIAGVWYETEQDFVDPNTWFHIEIKGTIHESSGEFECRLNEETVLSDSSICTQYPGQEGIARLSIGGGLMMWGEAWFDDVYLLDGNSPQNDFLGDSRIDTLYTSADGYYTMFTPSEGDNWECVYPEVVDVEDDSGWPLYIEGIHYDCPRVDFTKYNSATVAGSRDCYELDNISSLSKPIHACQQNSCYRKTDAGKKQVEQFLRISSTNYDCGKIWEATDFAKIKTFPWTYNPDTSVAWTESDINALQSGIEIVY